MTDFVFDATHPQWFLAHSLADRLRAEEGPQETDLSIGRARLDLWRQERLSFLRDEGHLADYIERKGTDRAGLVAVLGETAEGVRRRLPTVPGYVEYLRDALERPVDPEQKDNAGLRFSSVLRPLFHKAAAELRAAITALDPADSGIDTGPLADRLAEPPLETLDMLAGRAVALEINIARLEGRLKRDTPHERYHEFMESLSAPRNLAAFLADYPVLADDVVFLLRNWTRARLELAERLISDLPALREKLGSAEETGQPAEISLGAGDLHAGGRSVARLTFEGGQHVVYKPRSLGTERHFQDVLRWFNDRGLEPALRTLWVLDRGEYGWVEFVPTQKCADDAALGRFYTRLGAFLLVLHTLGASDMHFENIIASGEHPVMVDLEALFHVLVKDAPLDLGGRSQGAAELMQSSVLGVGLLPSPSFRVEDDEIVWNDFGGVTDIATQLTSRKVMGWDRGGTDEISLTRVRIPQGEAQNMPQVGDKKANAYEYRDDILTGYRTAYRILQDHRADFLRQDGPLAAFADDEIRMILRPTQLYYTLLTESWHPDYQQDALDRDNFLDALWSGYPDLPQRDAVIASEVTQIRAGDIPIFHSRPGTRDLYAHGRLLVAGMFDRSGLDRSRERIEGMSHAHREQQSWFIDAALAAHAMSGSHGSSAGQDHAHALPPATGPAAGDVLLAEAAGVGDRLVSTAIQQGERIAWLGLNLVDEQVWQVNPAQIGLFDGLSGIALFLGYLGHVTGDDGYRDVAAKAAAMIVDELDDLGKSADMHVTMSGIGAYGALGGSVYALSHLGHLWNDGLLLERAASVVPYLAERVDDDLALDVIGGCAGGILALLSLHAVAPGSGALAIAEKMGRRLAERAVECGGGTGWVSSVSAEPLAGFSHGASGIAVALARLDRARGTDEYRSLVLSALRFESGLFDDGAGNWADLRDDTAQGDFMVAWCHGATGVGLAREDLRGYCADEILREDIERAARAVEATWNGVGTGRGVGNHSICHGDLGNLELLFRAARTEQEREHVRALMAEVLVAKEHLGWRCGVPLGVETPGLMPGLAGIGHALVRSAAPDLVPSVLLLEPPRTSR
ncbi:type 2 lanthipeptide synthetase LanM family protein [Nonomuraea sp. LP-02]|uniref:type 2 lanthipeptide synthetase LanM family protein n=1 Tax=Nonomuraea sp. LP-02 TaxID=3097960 RepID=UPI002E312EB6|nr:type 2 lanthipeptide synthetase LanM family protein [Nonomuraea sp. LP-02]MED7929204.1 type 2 lanthipeptide synthetase LanM family protein [Nonomuraea sp. LP-02]